MAKRSFFKELGQRGVVQAAAIYGAVAWGVTEIVVTVVEQLFLPQWVSTLAVIGFVVGFPVAMFLAWTFDFTAEGIRRTEVTSRRGTASIVFSMILLVAGTSGLFLLIRPALQQREAAGSVPGIFPNSVAVLPFDTVGLGARDAVLGVGLSDELRDQLGRVAGLRIAARSSSQVAVEQRLDALEASTRLGVANLLEGSIRRQGNLLHISVQLVEGSSGLAVWSESFKRSSRELLAVQQTIADAVARQILPDAGPVVTEPATRDATANELMLLAHYYEQQVRSRQEVDTDKLLEATRLYREATEADPASALAFSRLAGVLLWQDVDAAEEPLRRALSLNPDLSEAQNTLGEFYWAKGNPKASDAFARAVELNPNNADALQNYANWLWLTVAGHESGREDPADLLRRALALDPLSLERFSALGDYLGKEGRADEVRSLIDDMKGLFENAESCRVQAWLHELIGEVDRAIAWTLRARDLEPDNADHVEKLAELYAEIGDFDTALLLESPPGLGLLFQMREYLEFIDQAEFRMIDQPDDMDVRYLLAFAYVAKGRFESAIHVLSTTGLPDSVVRDNARTVSEIEGFQTLLNALAGAELPESTETARDLAEWLMGTPWWGDIGWIGLNRSCTLLILGRQEEALQDLALVKQSPRLRRGPYLRDSWCFQQYSDNPVYRDVLRDQEQRKAALRERLPGVLAELGVEL